MSYNFAKFDDKDYYKISTTSEVKSLIYKIRKDASDSPYLNFDISDLILAHLPYLKNKNRQDELKETISSAIWYFKKGDENKIFKIIMEKIEASR
tara:strand:- start:149 stop:433 length:285 start_codon:yes stop_codon:yes gene_type:complete